MLIRSQPCALVNGEPSLLPSDGRTLIRWLRDDLGLTGTKHGCGRGHCGACTVLVDGKAVLACCTVASFHEGSLIVTIEGLARQGREDLLITAFVAEGAIQCGYCTPGMVVAARALLNNVEGELDAPRIRAALAGNICRCTGYTTVVAAVLAVYAMRSCPSPASETGRETTCCES